MAAELLVKKINQNAQLPKRGSVCAAGYDVCSSENMTIKPQCIGIVPTGLQIAVADGHYGRLASRSGLYTKHLISVGAGVIDSDYRGELKVVLHNFGNADFEVKVGDRIAQLIIEVIATPKVVEVDELPSSDRGAGGFGSTGVNTTKIETKEEAEKAEILYVPICSQCGVKLVNVEYLHSFAWKCTICQKITVHADHFDKQSNKLILGYST